MTTFQSRTDDSGTDGLEPVAEEFLSQLQAGLDPSIEQFVDRHPDRAEELRSLLQTIAMMEGLSSQKHVENTLLRFAASTEERIGEFRIVREIGRGGMGIVYEAIQASLGRRVALKVLSPHLAQSSTQISRFRREAEAVAQLHHTNIVSVYSAGEAGGLQYIAMQFVDGVPLTLAIDALRSSLSRAQQGSTDHLHHEGPKNDGAPSQRAAMSSHSADVADATLVMDERRSDPDQTVISNADELHPEHRPAAEKNMPAGVQNSTRPRSTSQSTSSGIDGIRLGNKTFHSPLSHDYVRNIIRIGWQLADALHHAHGQGILHRDIKPSNIMIDSAGLVWVTDFGLARVLDQQDLTNAGGIVGTIRYMAPEQLDGQSDCRSDVYSLGLTLCELLTLQPVFNSDRNVALKQRMERLQIKPPSRQNSCVPRDLDTIILKATSTDPNARYQTAADLGNDLRRLFEDRPILARRLMPWERAWRWSKRNPALATLTSAVFGLLAAVAAIESHSRYQIETAFEESETERQRAEGNLNSAIDAFDTVMANVTARGVPATLSGDAGLSESSLAQTSLTIADAKLLEQLLEFYRRFAAQNAGHPNLQRRIAQAQRQAGTILIRLGRLGEAADNLQMSLEIVRKEAAAHPDDESLITQQCSLLNNLGEVALRQGIFIDAFERHVQAMQIADYLPEQHSKSAELRYEIARAKDLWASLDIRSGSAESPLGPNDRQRGESMSGPRRPPEKRDRRPPEPPSDFPGPPGSDWGPPPDDWGPPPGEPGRRHDEFGQPEPPPGGFDDPGHHPPRPRDERDRSASKSQSNFDRPDDKGGPQGGPEESSNPRRSPMPMMNLPQIMEDGVNELKSLCREFPENTAWQQTLASALMHQAILIATQDSAKSIASLQESIAVLRKLIQQNPDDPALMRHLSETLQMAGKVMPNDDAVPLLKQSVTHAQALVERYPKSSDHQLLLGTALLRLGEVQADRSATESLESLRKALTYLEPLANQYLNQASVQIPAAQAMITIARQTERDAAQPVIKQLQETITRFEMYLELAGHNSSEKTRSMFNDRTRSMLYSTLNELNRIEPR